MGLTPPQHMVGFWGTVEGGRHDQSPIRVTGGFRASDDLLIEVGSSRTPSEDRALIALDDLAHLDATIGGQIEWPGPHLRAHIAADEITTWFADQGSGLLEEPFAGASLNATPCRLVACTVEEQSVLVEFDATWDVRLVDVLVLDASPARLSLLAVQAELTERHPETAPSVSQLRLIPFRWTAA